MSISKRRSHKIWNIPITFLSNWLLRQINDFSPLFLDLTFCCCNFCCYNFLGCWIIKIQTLFRNLKVNTMIKNENDTENRFCPNYCKFMFKINYWLYFCIIHRKWMHHFHYISQNLMINYYINSWHKSVFPIKLLYYT